MDSGVSSGRRRGEYAQGIGRLTPVDMSWLDRVVEEVSGRGLDPALVDVCRAFGGDEASDRVDPVEALAPRIVAVLSGEVDRDQAELFSRRFVSCAALLDGLSSVLHVALLGRMGEILEAAPPRALRVRACVDYFTSHGALLHHADPGAPTVDERVAEASWTQVAPGLSHALVEGLTDRGPIRVNLLRTTRSIRALDLRRGSLEGALAAVTGGYFLYSEPDVSEPFVRGEPVGLLVQDGHVVTPPFLRRAALVDGRIEAPTMVGWRVGEHVVASVNRLDGVSVFNRAFGERSPDAPWAIAMAHGRVLEAGPGELPIPLNGFVLALPHRGEAGPIRGPAISQAMAGGPMLLRDGQVTLELAPEDFAHTAPPITFSRDETFDQNLLPRMVVGRAGDALVFAAIDGRNFERAPGMTLGSSARLLRGLGCTTAMNLDGGSSKRMWVRGREVDLSSTELVASGRNERKRPIRTALVIE